jgi:CheY-like chemotaxis protein
MPPSPPGPPTKRPPTPTARPEGAGATTSAAGDDERTRLRRAEFAKMLMGAVPARPATTRPAKVPRDAVPAPVKPVGESSGPKVLVIDDDAVIRDMVVKVLCRENLVYQASDGASGLDLLRRIGPLDVIVCDVMMPRLDGFEFARAVKADANLDAVPILFLTARASAMDHVEGIQAGARSYLTKPFKVKDLLSAVAKAARGTGGGAR